jgi:hypothetical protein
MLKHELAARFDSDSHGEYASAKGAFIEAPIAKALQGAGGSLPSGSGVLR